MNMSRYLPYLAGTGVAVTWGLSFMFTKDALDSLSPFHLLGLRFAAAVAAMALLRAIGVIKINVTSADYLSLLPLAIFQPILYFSTETAGIMLTSASYSGMMIAATPIFVAILSALVLREKPSRLQVFFIFASVIGVIFIIFMDNQSIDGVNYLGTLALMGAVISAACYSIVSRKQSANHSPLKMTWVMMVFGAVVINIIGLAQQLASGTLAGYFAPLSDMWITVLYLGVISSVGAFFLFNYVLAKVTAAQGAVFINMIPVVAIAAGVLFRGEIVLWYHLLGTAAILGGVWGTNRFVPAPQEYREAESLAHSKT